MKRTFRLEKLVRDNIPALMQGTGQEVDYRQLTDTERLAAAQQKLCEEAAEIDTTTSNFETELADAQTALDHLVALRGLTQVEFCQIVAKRDDTRGKSTKNYFVETVTLDEDDPWAAYYAENPGRFPEITGDSDEPE